MNASTLTTPHLSGAAATVAPDNAGWTAKLPALLRAFGAAAVLFSLYTFLFRGWEGSGDLIRYTMLLGHTVMLAVIALASGHFFHEGKGPRLLLMLALVSVPVNFAILGAFIYAADTGANLADYPTYVAWSAGGMANALSIAGVAALLLVPVVLVGFRTLVRGMSLPMSLLFVISNLALLLPLREPLLVAGIAVALGTYTLFFSAKTTRQRTEVKTREGMIALLLQFLPMGILLGRNIWLYAPDAFLFAAIAATVFVALRHCTQFMAHSSAVRSTLELISVGAAAVTGICTANALYGLESHFSVALLSGGTVAAAMSYEVARRANSLNEVYRIAAVVMLCGSVLSNLMLAGGVAASLLTLFAGSALLVFSYFERKRSVFAGGVVLIVAGLVDQVLNIFQWFDFGYWAGLAVLGVLAIVAASLLEAKGKSLRQSVRHYRERYTEWSY